MCLNGIRGSQWNSCVQDHDRKVIIYDVAKMLADTVDTVEKHYASFIPAARDAAQSKMDNRIGIEERGRIAITRARKVVAFPASA
jgi:hypothetical protein